MLVITWCVRSLLCKTRVELMAGDGLLTQKAALYPSQDERV